MIKTYKPNDTARIQALLFNEESVDEAQEWALDDLKFAHNVWQVRTLEGWVDMPYESHLIRGTNKEFYPCDPDVLKNRWVEIE